MLDALVAFVQLQEGIAQFQSIKISLTKRRLHWVIGPIVSVLQQDCRYELAST